MNDARTYALWFGTSSLLGGAGALAANTLFESGLTTLGAGDEFGITANQTLNHLIGDSQRALLRQLFETGKAPEGLSQRTLQLYKTLAQRAISMNKDQLGVQAQRLQMIKNLLH